MPFRSRHPPLVSSKSTSTLPLPESPLSPALYLAPIPPAYVRAVLDTDMERHQADLRALSAVGLAGKVDANASVSVVMVSDDSVLAGEHVLVRVRVPDVLGWVVYYYR